MARYDGRPEQGGPAHKPQPREIARIVGAIVGLVVLIAFILDNSQTVRVGFVIFHSNVSLIWALLIAAILGALVDRLVILVRRHRKAGPPKD
jgi:uncharacterized integral membrane protein